MPADPAPSRERTAELVLHRPLSLAAGAARRLHVYLDGERAADLYLGATTRVPAKAGPHLINVRCVPLTCIDLPVILAPGETLQLLIYIDVLGSMQIDLVPTDQRLQHR